MNKERAFVTGMVSFLIIGSLIATGVTDGVYVAASIGFFLLCIAYAEWCARL
ncbi:MAG: hypothetical protein LV479_09175 [Methylacidiphilales bacterium]|nr:hypothetical protein [Candidatus Methylacidiphilales bacterium]